MAETIRVPDGLYGVAVTDTSISKSAADGTLTYRGYPIEELFDKASFEECIFLILEGRLPKRNELEEFVARLRSQASVPKNIYGLVKNLPAEAHPMDVLRTAVSGLGATERGLSPKEQQHSLIAKMPALVANCYRIVRGMDVVEPRSDLSQAANLLYMLSGKPPDRFDSWAFERELILYLEHDLNASTFTSGSWRRRSQTSTQPRPQALPRSRAPSTEEPTRRRCRCSSKWARRRTGLSTFRTGCQRKKIMGFGHRIYKKVDPRAQLSKGMLKRLLKEKGMDDGLYRLTEAVATAMWDAKRIPANLDFYAAPIFYTLSIPSQCTRRYSPQAGYPDGLALQRADRAQQALPS